MKRSVVSHRLLAAVTGSIGLAALLPSCGKVEQEECLTPKTTAFVFDKMTASYETKIDILLDIDNSRTMADKQAILALAVPDLVKGLVNPPCIDPGTMEVMSAPQGPSEACPPGSVRAVVPVRDMHIGVISSSLGGHGSDACISDGLTKASNNDRAHLLARKDPALPDQVETYQNLKFLAWDPGQELSPPGEADLDVDTATDPNGTALISQLTDMVKGVGQIGCGYESQLEAWYRFLIDPMPPKTVTLGADGKVELQGVDEELLAQRKAFLRPDSLLAIVMLTDENDCSIREQGQYYYAAQQKSGNGAPFHLPKARDVCDQSPNDMCCFSCGQTGPKDDNGNPVCPEDPTCKTPDGKVVYLDDFQDNVNIRCFDQKRRFGIDFLYGTDRYSEALRSQTVTDRMGQVVPNPIFTDLDPSDAVSNVRSSSFVFLVGIVGVPWQDIARTTASGTPDLANGLDPSGRPRGGFKTADELWASLPGKDYSTWDVILGDPEGYPSKDALPKDPLMIESIEEREGVNPITFDPLVTADQPLGNSINGHERPIPKRDDLQYACIFPLLEPRDCESGMDVACECQDPNSQNPLCAQNPQTGNMTLQARAKAYPGVRELAVLKDAGSQGIVASVCPVQLHDPKAPDFGYRAAMSAILDRLGPDSDLWGQCLSRSLVPDETGRVNCVLMEAQKVEAAQAGECGQCDRAGRDPVSAEHKGVMDAIQSEDAELGFNCFCEVSQLQGTAPGEPLYVCQNDPAVNPALPSGEPLDGYCYVDAAAGVGNPELVAQCPETEKRVLRFVGEGEPKSGSTLYIACYDDSSNNGQCTGL